MLKGSDHGDGEESEENKEGNLLSVFSILSFQPEKEPPMKLKAKP